MTERVTDFRQWLSSAGLDGFIVPSNDPHFSEYVAPRWQIRQWLTGFTGSAGTLAVTAGDAALWTDSRYFLQAEQELPFDISLQKMGVPGTPSMAQWFGTKSPGGRIGVDGTLFSKKTFDHLSRELDSLGLTLVAVGDPFGTIWSERPSKPCRPVVLLEDTVTGESTENKLARIRSASPNAIRLSAILDEIAWTLNIRGGDIDYNPLAVSYLSIEPGLARWFIDKRKLQVADIEKLADSGVVIEPYERFEDYLRGLTDRKVIVNPGLFDSHHYEILKSAGAGITEEVTASGSLINALKAIKNPVEVEGFRRAMVEDGVALVRFSIWLEEQLALGEKLTETFLEKRLQAFRAASPQYRGESFHAAVGYGEHGAFVHYTAAEESEATVSNDSFLLIDSGGHYLDGTTDITRMWHFGIPTAQQKKDYTNVLKGMIDLSRVRFPVGSRGAQLDMLARQHLWNEGQDYGHGTSHGVGHYLCVHEGPQSIRKEENPVTLDPGMVLSIEPGLYVTGEYGIRIENVALVTPSVRAGFLEFETLTLCPIDTTPLEKDLLEPAQRKWLNEYHRLVYDQLAPRLSAPEREWLARKTAPI